jgi:hypothetical protein
MFLIFIISWGVGVKLSIVAIGRRSIEIDINESTTLGEVLKLFSPISGGSSVAFQVADAIVTYTNDDSNKRFFVYLQDVGVDTKQAELKVFANSELCRSFRRIGTTALSKDIAVALEYFPEAARLKSPMTDRLLSSKDISIVKLHERYYPYRDLVNYIKAEERKFLVNPKDYWPKCPVGIRLSSAIVAQMLEPLGFMHYEDTLIFLNKEEEYLRELIKCAAAMRRAISSATAILPKPIVPAATAMTSAPVRLSRAPVLDVHSLLHGVYRSDYAARILTAR